VRLAPRLAAVLALLLEAGAAGAQVEIPAKLAPWLDAVDERVVDRAYVPSREQRVGEVRVVKRGAATLVETLLYTKVLSRAVDAIRKKEAANWPAHPDAERYIAALERAQQQIWKRLPTDARLADRRQKLWIDFVVAPGASFVALGAFTLEEAQGEVRVLEREPLALLELEPEYVRRNLLLITADAFHLDAAAAARLLGPLP
jgi:hypothetical protein